MPARVGTLVAILVVLAGCGASQSPSQQARAVVVRFYDDLESGNGDAACELLTRQVQEELVHPLGLFGGGRLDCRTLMSFYVRGLDEAPELLASLRDTRIGDATVTGDRAAVALGEPDGGEREAPLMKTARGWRISKLIERIRKPIGG